MEKFRYKILVKNGSSDNGIRQGENKELEFLNDMGNSGWELVSVTASSISYNI